ncbi:dUTP diphosphatase [Candidatus Mycoplasma mahonii]|uniref:dUTP diphosphatase n=1 Tax=Candidatus Mycoplasma mahonii TaxID=3004105 RepID=UPI0026EE8415|nr:dUTP diphosphatase [Candidatus Mycoplasma mahonii]WKX02519.1 dUTP diphosphatase [Candidatus Mycoplasma mahonii]
MNFTKIINMQRELDKSIISTHKIEESKVVNERILALLVEVGEFANEYESFKYWKIKKSINKSKLIEEFVDGIHFFSSLFIYLNIENKIVESIVTSENKNLQLMETFKAIVAMGDDLNEATVRYAFGVYLGNARLLKLSNEEIEKSYIIKNKVNFHRIKKGY